MFLVQDTTAVVHNTPGIVGFLTGYVFSSLVPLATAWITKNYFNLRDTWYARQSNLVKGLIYVVATAGIMVLLSYVGLGAPDNLDATNLSGDFIERVINALVVTLAVKLGINTQRERALRNTTTPRSTDGF